MNYALRLLRIGTTSTDSDFMNTAITGDESWVNRYDAETKSQSSQWKQKVTIKVLTTSSLSIP